MTTYYTTDSNGKITAASKHPLPPDFYPIQHETDREIVLGYDGQLYFAGEEPANPNPFDPVLSEAIATRNSLLAATDWYAIRASEPGGTPIPDDVLEYRRALREIDQQPGWPTDVSWPTLPSE